MSKRAPPQQIHDETGIPRVTDYLQLTNVWVMGLILASIPVCSLVYGTNKSLISLLSHTQVLHQKMCQRPSNKRKVTESIEDKCIHIHFDHI